MLKVSFKQKVLIPLFIMIFISFGVLGTALYIETREVVENQLIMVSG